MAAQTPSTIVIENLGSNNLYKMSFTDIDDADTYSSNILTVTAHWCNPTDVPTQNKEGIDVGYVASTGVFTFYTGEANRAGDLYVLASI